MTTTDNTQKPIPETIQHTPGPWTTYVNSVGDYCVIKRFPDGQECCQIARVSHWEDAQLIAAAPELLNALRKLLAYAFQLECEDQDGDGMVQRHIAIARAAIAKAIGASK